MSKIFTPRFLFFSALVILAALTRFLPHPPNFTPIGGIALFGGAYFLDKKWAFAVPIAAMLLSDLFIGFHSTMWAVYLSFILIALVGLQLKNKISFISVLSGALGASFIFFIITNFAVWMGSTFYPQNISGLAACYIAAIPFFGNTIMGDVFFSAVLFGGAYLAQKRIPALARA